jgi:hypothetical protein
MKSSENVSAQAHVSKSARRRRAAVEPKIAMAGEKISPHAGVENG